MLSLVKEIGDLGEIITKYSKHLHRTFLLSTSPWIYESQLILGFLIKSFVMTNLAHAFSFLYSVLDIQVISVIADISMI